MIAALEELLGAQPMILARVWRARSRLAALLTSAMARIILRFTWSNTLVITNTEGERDVHRPDAYRDQLRPDELFDFVADQTNAPRWQKGLAEVRRVTPGPPRLLASMCSFAGSRDARWRPATVTPAMSPRKLVEFEIPEGWVSGRASYRVEPRPGGSVLISTMTFGTRGHGRAIEGVLLRLPSP